MLEVDDRGRIASAVIEQTCAPGFETLRPHTLAIGLYAVRDGALHRTDRLELDVDGERTEVPALVGREQPDLLLVNDDDLAYAKIRLDERSLATALAHPRGFTSSLPRSLVLASLWDMTRDAEMGARHFVDVVLETLPGESRLARCCAPSSPSCRPRCSPTPRPEHRDAVRQSTRDRLWEIARAAEPGSDAQLQLVSAAAALTTAGDDTTQLRALLDGTEVLEGLTVDFEMRWTLLTALVAAGAAGAPRSTPSGPARTPRPGASGPPAPARRGRPPRPRRRRGPRPSRAPGCRTPSSRRSPWGSPARAPRPSCCGRSSTATTPCSTPSSSRGSHAIVEAIVHGFYPRPIADRELYDRTQAWLDAHPDAPAALRRLVVENRDPVVRALAAQERDARD